jgi:AsmA-like protein
MEHSGRARKWRRRLLIAAGVILLGAVLFRWVVGEILLGKLASLAADRLHAQLTADLVYNPPYTLVASNCRLLMQRGRLTGDEIDVAEIRVVLGGIPVSGPLKIREIRIRQPILHVFHPADRLNDLANLSPSTQPSTPPTGRISDRIQLGHLSLEGGKIVLENGSATSEVQIGLDVKNSAAGAPGAYALTLAVADPAAAVNFNAQGAVDLDDRSGSIASAVLVAETSQLDSPTLPNGIRKILAEYRPSGSVRIEGSGQFSARDAAADHFSASLDLQHLKGYSPELGLPIDDLHGALRAQGDSSGTTLGIAGFSLSCGGTRFALDDAAANLVGGMLNVTKFRGTYGADQFAMVAQIPESQLAIGDARLNDLDATINFHPPSPVYEDSVQSVFNSLRPSGPYRVTGWFDAPAGQKSDYNLQITTEGGALKLVSRSVDMTQIYAVAELVPGQLQITRLDATALGGELRGDGHVQTIHPNAYSGNLHLKEADLPQVVALLAGAGVDTTNFKGVADVRGSFSGGGKQSGKSAADLLMAQGQFEVTKADLWSVPALQLIARKFSFVRNAITLSQAAAYFHVQDQRVQLEDAALSSTVIGLRGSGTVDFDGNLDLDIVAAPVADWQHTIARTGIPIVSDVAGGIAGGVQKLFTTATGQLLYRFHITGTASDPHLTAVPAPILTVNAARLFYAMLNPSGGSLLSFLHGPSTQPASELDTEPTSEPAATQPAQNTSQPATTP